MSKLDAFLPPCSCGKKHLSPEGQVLCKHKPRYDPAEQDLIIETFSAMLKRPTADGGRKRELGEKVPWTVDPGHEEAMFRHLYRWSKGERRDPDSGAHPLIHVAWRALALAWQEGQ